MGYPDFGRIVAEREFRPETLSAIILRKLAADAATQLGEITGCVITVPAYFDDTRRKATMDAGRIAGLSVLDIIDEPFAAVLAYSVSSASPGPTQTVLVYDLGGGTFDVSVLQLSGNVFEVLATGGDTFLGGVDFDNRIIDYVLEDFWREHKIDLADSAIAMQRVKKGAEAAKIDLSLIPNVAIDLPYIEEKKGRPLDVRLQLSRQRLNELTHDLVERTFEICDQALAERSLRPRDIDEIILVGGQSRMPLVQQKILEHFGKPPRKGVHPDECVALGAALLADSLDAIDSVTLVDVLSMPIGIATPTSHFRRILDKNQTIPSTKSFRLPPPREPGQPIEIDIYQGDSDLIVDNEFLGSLRLPAAATGRRIDFKLDEECLLKVSFEDPVKGLTNIELATRDTPEALRKALAGEASRRDAGEAMAAGEEKRGGLFRWLKRS
jgi:molecular chaperone DnaK